MKLSSLAELSADILMKYYENNTKPFFDCLHEDLLWIGPAKNQIVRTKKALEDLFAKEKNTLTFSMFNISATPFELSKTSVEVFLRFVVDTFWPDGSSNRVYQRITLSWQTDEDAPKIRVCHISNAIDYDARDTIYPIHYIEKHSQLVLYSKSPKTLHFSGKQKSILYTNSDQIIFLESMGNYTLIHTTTQVFECTERLSALAKKLGDGFLRCHISFLVNPQYISSIERFHLTLTNGRKIPIPEKKYTAVKAKLLKN